MAQSPAGIGCAPRRGHPRCAVPWVLSPHPSPLPWGEGEPFSPRRTIRTRRLSTARCAVFPLPEGEGQGEGKRRELLAHVWDHYGACRTARALRRNRRFPNMTMSPALLYLWWTLLKRRTHSFARDLRRPTKLIGFAALVGLVGFLFYFREHEFV